MSVSIKFDSRALEAKLDKLGKGIAEKAVRPAAEAGARVFRDEVVQRVPKKTGLLRSAIYEVFSEKESTDEKSVYHVSWNKRKAPHGQLVEYGTVKMSARPFLRPAYDAKKAEALKASQDKFNELARGVIDAA